MIQQSDKLLPDALSYIFHHFNDPPKASRNGFRLLAADGTDINFTSNPLLEDYYQKPGRSNGGICSVHLNALYELGSRVYTDAVIHPCHAKDEFRAFCDMVDRYPDSEAPHTIWIADRGFSYFNTFAHVIEKGGFFLIRTKDVASKGLAGRLPLPSSGVFDLTVTLNLI
nr:transposase [Enterocloster clostridioformis]